MVGGSSTLGWGILFSEIEKRHKCRCRYRNIDTDTDIDIGR